jgi:hypothetical protein
MPVNTIDERAKQLKQSLVAFVLDAEGDLAIALEAFIAEHLNRFPKSQSQSSAQTDLAVDCFLTQGRVGDKTPLDLFLEHHANLSQEDRKLLARWTRSFTGLFAVTQTLMDGFEIKNWLTEKRYVVRAVGLQPPEQIDRLQPNEIVITRLAPIAEAEWMFFSAFTLLGKLGKPKLAVAVGNFKKCYCEDLYGDAPELLEEAWRSVEQSHQEWLDFFGSEEVTLPGYKANQQLQLFQEHLTQRRFAAAGIDSNQSLADLIHQSGGSEAESAPVTQGSETADSLGKSPTEVSPQSAMVPPQFSLPDALKKAEQVTLLTHPRWGQVYLSSYPQLKALLEQETAPTEKDKKIVHQALSEPEMNAYLWHRLAQQYPVPLERLLQDTLAQPFSLSEELDPLLQSYNKPLKPILPETASVPVHLHSLFQDAVVEVHKTQVQKTQKPKDASKVKKGFQRR